MAFAGCPRPTARSGGRSSSAVASPRSGILLPAAAPAIVAGLRTALVGAWIGTIGAEYLIGTGSGLGVFLAAARERGRMDRVVAAMALLALIGLGLDLALRRLGGGALRTRTA